MQPYRDNDPRRSWEICPGKYCRQLFQGRLWKCPTLAYLQLQDQLSPVRECWHPYLKYTPLEATCSDAELDEFLLREEESYCAMCPAFQRPFAKPNPLRGKS
jgi:hypothetical protein